MRPARGPATTGAMRAWFALAAMGMMVAACSAPASREAAGTAAPSSSSDARAAASASPAKAVVPQSGLLVAASLSPDHGESAPLRAPRSLAELKGLPAEALEAALGRPALLRRDGAAELWQYPGPGCTLHLYLYKEGPRFRVSFAEVRIDDRGFNPPPTCIPLREQRPAAAESAAAAAGVVDSPPLAAVAPERLSGN